MCERRNRKIKKGSNLLRLREARRLYRLRRRRLAVASLSSTEEYPTPPSPVQSQSTVEKNAQCRVIIELAWRTIALMHKNTVIQQKIVALQKETSDFVASVMSNPENRQKYPEAERIYHHSVTLEEVPKPLVPIDTGTKFAGMSLSKRPKVN